DNAHSRAVIGWSISWPTRHHKAISKVEVIDALFVVMKNPCCKRALSRYREAWNIAQGCNILRSIRTSRQSQRHTRRQINRLKPHSFPLNIKILMFTEFCRDGTKQKGPSVQ